MVHQVCTQPAAWVRAPSRANGAQHSQSRCGSATHLHQQSILQRLGCSDTALSMSGLSGFLSRMRRLGPRARNRSSMRGYCRSKYTNLPLLMSSNCLVESGGGHYQDVYAYSAVPATCCSQHLINTDDRLRKHMCGMCSGWRHVGLFSVSAPC